MHIVSDDLKNLPRHGSWNKATSLNAAWHAGCTWAQALFKTNMYMFGLRQCKSEQILYTTDVRCSLQAEDSVSMLGFTLMGEIMRKKCIIPYSMVCMNIHSFMKSLKTFRSAQLRPDCTKWVVKPLYHTVLSIVAYYTNNACIVIMY